MKLPTRRRHSAEYSYTGLLIIALLGLLILLGLVFVGLSLWTRITLDVGLMEIVAKGG
jgi:hypothetical protein